MIAIYYKLYFDKHNDIVVVTIENYDESKYKQYRFLTDKHFSSENEAHEWYNLSIEGRNNKTENDIKNLKLENSALHLEVKLLRERIKTLEAEITNIVPKEIL